jgi:hypothetical protein
MTKGRRTARSGFRAIGIIEEERSFRRKRTGRALAQRRRGERAQDAQAFAEGPAEPKFFTSSLAARKPIAGGRNLSCAGRLDEYGCINRSDYDVDRIVANRDFGDPLAKGRSSQRDRGAELWVVQAQIIDSQRCCHSAIS